MASTKKLSFLPTLCLVLLANALSGLAEGELNPAGLRLLEQQECGNYEDLPGMFVSEVAVALGSRPWMAVMQSDTGDYLCAGTLISDRFVLTAAHCATFSKVHSVRLGDQDLTTEPDCTGTGKNARKCMPPTESYDIERITVHDQYDSEEHRNDIALIKLARKVDFKEHISPICLPVNSTLRQKLKSLENVFVTGWGVDINKSDADILRETKISYSNDDQAECFSKFRGFAHPSHQICTSDSLLCKGTSGGPLSSSVEYNAKKRIVQYGVLAYGLTNCGKVVSSNVVKYMPWITDVLAQK